MKKYLLVFALFSTGLLLAPSSVYASNTYATWNPSDKGAGITLSNGNLTETTSATAAITRSTISKSSGKWYWEVKLDSGALNAGVATSAASLVQYLGGNASGWGYFYTGLVYNNNIGSGSNAAYTAGDTIGFALNMDTGVLTFYKNNVAQPTTVSGLSGAIYAATGSNNVGTGTANFGATPFTYTPPSGYNAGLYNVNPVVYAPTYAKFKFLGGHYSFKGGKFKFGPPPPPPRTVEYLVVAGGGGGDTFGGDGGGAGGLLTATGYVVTVGSPITVTVGTGGATGVNNGVQGGNSVFGSITATGGGYADGVAGHSGGNGGSGGMGAAAGGTGIVGQGHNGSTGAGGGSSTAASGITPGAGTASSISGSSVTYATGAGSGTPSTNPGDGGFAANAKGTNGTVIIRYPDTDPAAASTTGSPTITVTGGYRIYNWTASGSITF